MTRSGKRATICPGDLFEIGLVVPNLERAIEQFHRALGYTFSPIVEGVLPTRDDEGESVIPLRMVVSRESPNLELIEGVPGTAMVPPAGTGLHHLGYYVDDLLGESERLRAIGLPLVRGGFSGSAYPAGWIYHEMPDGTLLELVDRRTAILRKCLIAGEVPDSPMVHRIVPLPAGLGGRRSGSAP